MKIRLIALISALLFATIPTLRAQESKIDFGDHVSSTLTSKAWTAQGAKDVAAVKAYVNKCKELYQAEALKQQASLTEAVPTSDKDKVFAQWALNDVGTCYFILGQALEQAGDTKGALEAYKFLVEKLPFAQCWDTKGWFWKPAEAARTRIKALAFDSE